ncbi:ATP-binding cassette domain-containing protein [Streptomyces bambusae]|uniref:ABC transporter permease subunit n=1 Tax=Streptomyces bambusae TaxID=1550616 RepID=UPI001CFD7FD8|nr:ATP-binding cassette domain-containing protein [Streptomyces bambusae]MCB5167088.1 ATP-binding cassette domain-containing protein [Streptomyces bambusae]
MAGLTYELTLAGLAVGGAAALSGIGLIVTYRATGVLNLAHGAVAMVCAYVFRWLAVDVRLPAGAAAAVTLLVLAPGTGLLLERAVFRPLAVREAGPERTLVATIGVFVLLVGGALLVWGPGARADVPRLPGTEPWPQLAAVAVLSAGVLWADRGTRFGRELRAVVDNRRLAALSGVDADRVAAVGWAFGAFTAGLTGVLLAPYVRLDPYGLPLLVLEVLAVAVLARLRSIPVAVFAALALGVAQAQLTRFHPDGWAAPLLQSVTANLFVLALLGGALAGALPAGGAGRPLAVPGAVAGRRGGGAGWWAVLWGVLLLPFAFGGSDLQTAVQVPALAVVLLSLVVVSGRGGQISLGQAAYAGLGALFTAHLAMAGVPGLVALGCAVLLVAPLGLLTGYPAIRRRGLALALVTLAFGVAVSRFVFVQPYATAGLVLPRPAGFADDRAYYALELGLLAAVLAVVTALRRGRTGRALAALRDHEAGAGAAGVRVPRLKLLAFTVGAGLAALGGGMLGMGARAFDPDAFDPVRGLLWFAALVVVGHDSTRGAVVAAALLVGLDAGPRGGLAAAVIGVLACLVGRLPLSVRRGVPRPAVRRPRPVPPDPAGRPIPPGEQGLRPHSPAPQTPARLEAPAGPRTPAEAEPGGAGAGGAGPVLVAEGIEVRYPDGYLAVRGVSVRVSAGRVVGVVGGNGAGKSTLFQALCGGVGVSAGRVAVGGRDVTRWAAHERARAGVGRSFQQLAVFGSLSVEDNVRVGAEQGYRRGGAAAVERALRLFGLDGPVRHAPTAGLPTGTLRRVELARVLAGGPRVLLLDEPAAGLDAAEAAALARILGALAADGLAVLIVEHDLDLVAALADTVHVMAQGVLDGP